MDKKNWGWVDGNTSGWDLVEENKSGEGGGGSWSENIGDISDRVKKIKLGTGLGGGGGSRAKQWIGEGVVGQKMGGFTEIFWVGLRAKKLNPRGGGTQS